MSEIPQDVRDKAREIAAYCERAGLDEDIARAIMAERERCIRLARNAYLNMPPEDRAVGDILDDRVQAAIRRGN